MSSEGIFCLGGVRLVPWLSVRREIVEARCLVGDDRKSAGFKTSRVALISMMNIKFMDIQNHCVHTFSNISNDFFTGGVEYKYIQNQSFRTRATEFVVEENRQSVSRISESNGQPTPPPTYSDSPSGEGHHKTVIFLSQNSS
jgi:hypothetical protein